MKIRKIGHCCLVIETHGKKIVTDPGTYSKGQEEERDVDLIVITHEHADHLHLDSLKELVKHNPQAEIITNQGVATILDREGIAYTLVRDGMHYEKDGLVLEGMGTEHAVVYPGLPGVENTGYFIAEQLFYPGDAFYEPKRHVPILALPIAGPWMKISDCIDYAKVVHPDAAFPVHDGMYKDSKTFAGMVGRFLHDTGINYVSLSEGESHEFAE